MIQILFVWSDWGILALHIVLAAIFLVHGIRKLRDLKGTTDFFAGIGFKPGHVWGTLVAAVETLGGVALLLGLFTQIAAIVLAIQFLVIVGWKLKLKKSFSDFELDLVIFAALVALATLGGGRFSLENYWNIIFF